MYGNICNTYKQLSLANNFVRVLNVSGKLLNKIFFSEISTATGFADIIFKKNNFVRTPAAVIFLHVAPDIVSRTDEIFISGTA